MNHIELMRLFHLAGKLKEIKRTGWEKRQINLPESVADHSFRVAFISMILADELGADPLKLLQMSLVHDLAESIVGDITPYCGVSVEDKRDQEEKAMREIFRDMAGGDYFVNLMSENLTSPENR